MSRLARAAICAALLGVLATGSVSAAKPEMFIIDVSTPEFEADQEAFFLELCGYPIDFEGTGHIVIHVFNDNPRLLQISNFRLFETFSANGKTIEVRPDSGPDRVWIGQDGNVYLAIVGRSVTGSGVIGRTVINLSTGEFVSSTGRELGDFLGSLCEELAPA
jgi:hypothetical protein